MEAMAAMGSSAAGPLWGAGGAALDGKSGVDSSRSGASAEYWWIGVESDQP